jgi:hypothetical protein
MLAGSRVQNLRAVSIFKRKNAVAAGDERESRRRQYPQVPLPPLRSAHRTPHADRPLALCSAPRSIE